jgi:hypothetical protein
MFRVLKNLRKPGAIKSTRKYLLYAVGEIILVVIGILIALYINNESELYKEKQDEIVLLKKLKEENLYNIDALKGNEKYHEDIPDVFLDFVQFLSENRFDSITDSLSYYFNRTMNTPIYSFSEGNLNNYISSQKNNFPEINKEVIYLENLQDDLFQMSEKCVDLKLEDYYKYLNKDLDFYTGEVFSVEGINAVEFRNNVFLLQSVEEELSRIFGLTLTQMRKVDSLLTDVLKEE